MVSTWTPRHPWRACCKSSRTASIRFRRRSCSCRRRRNPAGALRGSRSRATASSVSAVTSRAAASRPRRSRIRSSTSSASRASPIRCAATCATSTRTRAYEEFRHAEHRPVSSRAAGDARAGLPRVPRRRRDGKWLPPNGFTGKVHHMEAKVGGSYKMSFTNFTTGKSHSFGGKYVDSCRTSASATRTSSTTRTCPGEMQVDGHAEEGVRRHGAEHRAGGDPGVIPAEACYLGWQESLTLLATSWSPRSPRVYARGSGSRAFGIQRCAV